MKWHKQNETKACILFLRNKYSFFFPIFGMILLVFFVRVSLFSSFFFSFLCDIYLSLSLAIEIDYILLAGTTLKIYGEISIAIVRRYFNLKCSEYLRIKLCAKLMCKFAMAHNRAALDDVCYNCSGLARCHQVRCIVTILKACCAPHTPWYAFCLTLVVTKTQTVVGIQDFNLVWSIYSDIFHCIQFSSFFLLYCLFVLCLSTICDWGLYLFINTVLHKRNARLHVITIMKSPYKHAKIKYPEKKTESKTHLSQSCQPTCGHSSCCDCVTCFVMRFVHKMPSARFIYRCAIEACCLQWWLLLYCS